MDPFEHITRQCQTSSSQEQILRDLILSIDSSQEDRLNILSNDDEEEEPYPNHHLFSPPTQILICSPPDTAPSNEEQQSHVRRSSPENRTGFDDSNHTQKSEPTNVEPLALEEDPMICDPPLARRNSPEPTTSLDEDTQISEPTEIGPLELEKDPMICDPPLARRNAPETTTSLDDDTQKSEPTKMKLPGLEKDPVIWEGTTNRCSSLKEKSSMETNLGVLQPLTETACIRDGMDSGFAEKSFEDLVFLKEKGDCSSKDNGLAGENAESPKKSNWGSSVEPGICEEADQGNAGEGNAERHVGSLRKSPITPENAGGSRRLPSWIRNQSKEKEGGSSRRRDMALEKSILAKLMEVASASSNERDRGTGVVDVFQAAQQAGYTFPRPRWWPPEDEFQ